MAKRRPAQYIGGTSLITGCADGDCRALDILRLIAGLVNSENPGMSSGMVFAAPQSRGRQVKPLRVPKRPRRASAYSKRYGRAFKKLAPKYKTKAGGWKKDGFRRCAAAARKEAKK